MVKVLTYAHLVNDDYKLIDDSYDILPSACTLEDFFNQVDLLPSFTSDRLIADWPY